MKIRIILELNGNEGKNVYPTCGIHLNYYTKGSKQKNPLRKKEVLKINDLCMQLKLEKE